jgi:hypothetical protein
LQAAQPPHHDATGRTWLWSPLDATAHSGLRWAVWTTAILLEMGFDLRLRLSPRGSGRATIERFAGQTMGSDKVEFDDAPPPSQCVGLGLMDRAADVTAIPLMMASGVPIVASDLPALRELLGEAAIYVPPGQPQAHAAAVLKLLEDQPLATSLATAARSRAGQFSPAAVASQLGRIYSQLCG